MRILHTSDLHIGKRLMGRERLDEQSQVLTELALVCEREKVELVLIAGDVFDTYTPSAEAEELFYSSIKRIAGENRAVLIISGNHDDGVRLQAVSPFSHEQGVYIIGNNRAPLPTNSQRACRPVLSGKGYATFETASGERVYVGTLPYPNEARFKEEKSELSHVERMTAWMQESMQGNLGGDPAIFMAHIFVAGGKVSDGEREIDLGGARAVPVDCLPKCDYIALGHLHKKQHMGKGHCYYSGSPLQYAFDESADKSFKVFNLDKTGVHDLIDIPIESGKKLVRLQAESVESANALLKTYENALVEMTLLLNAPLLSADAQTLSENSNLVSLLTHITSTSEETYETRKGMTDAELFTAFYQANYSQPPEKELQELFLTTLNEL